jgi:hypothetical protein
VTLPRGWRRVAVITLVVVLAGATAFGLWHVLVGGLVNGNPRAAAFGITLTSVAGAFLAGLLVGIRRHPAA